MIGLDDIFQKLVEAAIAVLKDIVSNTIQARNQERRDSKRHQEHLDATVQMSASEARTALRAHIESISRWAANVGFSDLHGTRALSDIFVHLDAYLTPTRLQMSLSERNKTIQLNEAILSSKHHCLILGQPGAGKTTSMKKLCNDLLSRNKIGDVSIPILILLRDLQTGEYPGNPLLREMAKIFPFHLDPNDALKANTKDARDFLLSLKENSLVQLLDRLNLIIILDGFDELPNNEHKPSLANHIRRLALSLSKSRLIITCRSGEFNYNIDNSSTFEIAPLSEHQISVFASRWISDQEGASKFLTALGRSPFTDVAIKPLLLAHLCAIYQRIGDIPQRPRDVYRKIIMLLAETWDEQRSIRRLSNFSNFDPLRKVDFLIDLAYVLTTQSRSASFDRSRLLDAYHQIHSKFKLDESEADLVVSELESHTGLFLQAGFDRFEFVHKSLQEFLTAEYLRKLPPLGSTQIPLSNLGAELAIATTLAQSNEYFEYLTFGIFYHGLLTEAFYDAFFSRLAAEKPDFYKHNRLTLSFLCALSFWINRGPAVVASTAISFSAEKEGRYGLFINLTLDPFPSDVLAEYYDVNDVVSIAGQVSLLRRKRHRDGVPIPQHIWVPNYIFSKKATSEHP